MRQLTDEQWQGLHAMATLADAEVARLNAALASEQAKVAELAGALREIEDGLANSKPIDYKRDCYTALKQARQALSRAGGAR